MRCWVRSPCWLVNLAARRWASSSTAKALLLPSCSPPAWELCQPRSLSSNGYANRACPNPTPNRRRGMKSKVSKERRRNKTLSGAGVGVVGGEGRQVDDVGHGRLELGDLHRGLQSHQQRSNDCRPTQGG